MLLQSLPFVVLIAALLLAWLRRTHAVARGFAIVMILVIVVLPIIGIRSSHQLAIARYVDARQETPSDDYQAGATAARDVARERLPLLGCALLALSFLSAFPRSQHQDSPSTAE